jgi:hypothetical protein
LTASWGAILSDLNEHYASDSEILSAFATATFSEVDSGKYRLELNDKYKAKYAELARAIHGLGYTNVGVVGNMFSGPRKKKKRKK